LNYKKYFYYKVSFDAPKVN
jgi:hypothetical protein